MEQDRTRRWLIFFLASTLFLLSQFFRASVAVIAPDLMIDPGLDAQGLSTVSAAFFYAFAIMQIPIGIYLDNLGPRRTMTLLSLVAAAGALIFAWGDSLGWLTLGRVCLGIGMACNFMGSLKLLTLWFAPRQFATLSAIMVSLGTAGNLAAATPLVLAVQAMGWRRTFVWMAVATALLTIVFSLVARNRPRTEAEPATGPPVAPKLSETLHTARLLSRSAGFWIISMGTFCRYGIYAAVQALWAGPFLMQIIGLSPVAAGNVLLMMNIGLIVGSPLSGWFSDWVLVSRKKVIIAGLIGMGAALAALSMLPPVTGAVTVAALFFSFGLFSGAGQIMYAHVKEMVPLRHAGLAMTGINFFTMLGVAVFLQGLGRLMTRFYPETALGPEAFTGAFGFCAGCLLVMALVYAMTRETLSRK
ncbi:MAG: MFS transporter [Desulfobacterales bacterium]|nr:MFS transporter [Desulfobacterales bacterium]